MGQRVIGLDIGASAIKVCVYDTSFRRFELVDVISREVPRVVAGEDDNLEELQRETLAQLLRELRATGVLQGEAVVTALPGDRLSSRVMTLPFTDRKQIESTIGFELENYLPYDVDELVYDYTILEVGDAQTRLLASAVEREYFEDLLALFAEVEVDPRLIGVGPLAFVHILKHLPIQDLGAVAIIDMGAEHTDIAVFRGGQPELVRTVRRGGEKLTQALANELGTERDRAEMVKREEGVIALEGTSFADERAEAIARACRNALDPLLQRIHMSLQARMGQDAADQEISRIYLCGGGANLRGIYDYIEEVMEVPVEPLPLAQLGWNKLDDQRRTDLSIAKAASAGLRATAGGRPDDINFRRGTYAYKGDFALMRGKLIYLALLVLVLLGVAGFKSYLQFGRLSDELDNQYAQLGEFSKEVLGRESEDFDAVLTSLNDVPEVAGDAVFPRITATRALYDITGIMTEVSNTSREDVMRMRGQDGAAAPTGAGAGEPAAATGAAATGAAANPGTGMVPGTTPPTPGVAPPLGTLPTPPVAPVPGTGPRVVPTPPGMPAPGGVRPPGPAQVAPPRPGMDRLQEERARRLREFRERRANAGRAGNTPRAAPGLDTGARPTPVRQPRNLRPPTAGRAAADRPRGTPVTTPTNRPKATSRQVSPGTPVRRTPPATEPAAGTAAAPGAEGEAKESAQAEDPNALRVELETVEISDSLISLKGEANTLEAVSLFEQKLKEHRCFGDTSVEGTERITFERHRNWYLFRIQISVACGEETKES